MTTIKLGRNDYALLVDLIGAFFRNGGLAVPGAEEIVSPIRSGIEVFVPEQRIVIREEHCIGAAFSVDSYVGRTQGPLTIQEVNSGQVQLAPSAVFTMEELQAAVIRHTYQQMMLWNAHAHTPEERLLHPELRDIEFLLEMVKGRGRLIHSYSPFFDDLMQPTGLAAKLRSLGARRTFSFGLAEDFCAGLCALHAAWEGFESYLIEDWCRSIDLPPMDGKPGTVEGMRQKLDEAGVIRVTSDQLRYQL